MLDDCSQSRGSGGPFLAPLRHADELWECLFIGVDRKSSAPPPKRTSPGGARIVFADIPVAPPRCLAMQLIVLVSLRTTPFYGITHFVEYKGREGRHPLPLFGTKRLVEWPPRLGEFIQIG